MFRGGDYVDKTSFREPSNKPSYSLSTQDIEGAQPKNRSAYALRNSQRLGGAGAAIMDPSSMDPAGAEKVQMGVGSKGMSDILNQGERYVPKNQRDALSTHDINGGVKKNAYGAVMTMEDRLKNETAGGFVRKPQSFQEEAARNMQSKGRNASQIVLGDNMQSATMPNNENMPPPHLVLTEDYVRQQQEKDMIQKQQLAQSLKSIEAQSAGYQPRPMENGLPPQAPSQPLSQIQPPADASRFADKYGSQEPPRQQPQGGLPSYQEMRASAYKDMKPSGGTPSGMYQPLDMSKLKENLPTGGNPGISHQEQMMLDQMMQDYYKDRKYNSGIMGKNVEQMPQNGTAQPPQMQQMPPSSLPPQPPAMSQPNGTYSAPPGQQQPSQKEIQDMMKAKEQESLYQEWKRNPIQDYQTINSRSQPSSEMALQPTRQRSHQEKSLSGLGYGRANSYNAKEIGQAALDQKYRVKDFSHEDPTGWVDPRAPKFSTVALQAQGHQLPPLPKPRITPYPKGLSIIQDPNYMNSMKSGSNQEQRRSLRSLHNNNVEDQKRIENSFYKPGVTPTNLEELYFKAGEKRSPGRRIQPNKNYSSQERALGLEYASNSIVQSADHGERQRGSSPGSDPNQQWQGGKRQYASRNNSQRDLIRGQYGYDPIQGSPNRNKPYSKHHISIDKPKMYTDGQNLPIEQSFKQQMNKHNPII